MRGRKPKPTALKKLQGNAGRRPLNNSEPIPPVSPVVPEAPIWLDAIGRACWVRVVGTLHPIRLATDGDLEALFKYCDVFSQWWKARESLAKNGQTFELFDLAGNVRGVQQRPEVSIYRNLLLVLMKYEAEFGMTPGSRSRIRLPEKGDDKPKDDFEAFMNGGAFGVGPAGEA